MSYKFQKWYYTILFTMFLACTPDYDFEIYPYDQVMPEELAIEKEVGLKLENRFATDVMLMNVKINTAGVFTIKVLDIQDRVVAKELVTGKSGDNLFKVYVNTLPSSSYRFELFCDDEKVGAEVINLL